MVGKLGGQGRLNNVPDRQLIHMVDLTSTNRFLVDTGASYSILPYQSSLMAKGPKLFGPVGQIIRDHLLHLHFEISFGRCFFSYIRR